MQSFSNWAIWGRSRLMEEDERKQAWKTPWLAATVARTSPASLFACFPRCSFCLVTALPLIISSSSFSSHYLHIPCQVLHGPLLNVEEGDGITFSTILNRKTAADLYWQPSKHAKSGLKMSRWDVGCVSFKTGHSGLHQCGWQRRKSGVLKKAF